MTAGRVISGSGLTAATLRQVRALPGVRAAAGVTPVSVAATDPDLEEVYGEAVTAGPLGRLLDLGVLAALSAVALVNTLAVTTVERRRVLRLLGRLGATRSQAAAVFGWQAAFVAIIGLAAGVAAGAVTLLAVTRAVTGTWTPYIPLAPALALVAAVAAITAGAVMIPFRMMSRREPALVSGRARPLTSTAL